MLFLAIFLLQSVAEREFESTQQSAAFVIVLGSGGQGNVQTAESIDLVVVDFRENDLLFNAHAGVTTTIEGLGIQAAEVANPRQGDRQQTIQEFIHTIAAQSHFDADRPTFTDFKASDGFPSVSHNDLLTGDLFQVSNSVLDDFFVADRFAKTHVQGDLCNALNFYHVRQLKFFLKLRSDFLPVNLF